MIRVGLRLSGPDKGWIPDPARGARVDLLLEEADGDPDVWMGAVCDLCMTGHVVEFADASAHPPPGPCEGCGNPPIALRRVRR